MRFFHFLTYAIVLGFFAVACSRAPQPMPTAHISNTQKTFSQNRLLDADLLPADDAADSLADQSQQY